MILHFNCSKIKTDKNENKSIRHSTIGININIFKTLLRVFKSIFTQTNF